jgi:hypothetical protein
MKSEEEVVSKLRDRVHRAQRRWFRRFPDRPKEELYLEFHARMKNPEILLREYKDITTLLWVLGEFDRLNEETPWQQESPGTSDGIKTSQSS